MAIVDLYSKRKRQEQAGEAVYRYDDLPRASRVQIVQVMTDGLGAWERPHAGNILGHLPNRWWTDIHDTVARETGKFRLSEIGSNPFDVCASHLLNSTN